MYKITYYFVPSCLGVSSINKGVFMTDTIRRYESGVFCARIYDTNTNVLLTKEEIDSISYTAFKLSTKSLMSSTVTRTAITGHTDIAIDKTTTLFEEAINDNYWNADETGYNFLHIPDTRENAMFSDTGNYEIIYTINLISGNPVILTFEVTVS